LDVGSHEKIVLVSRDEQSIYVVSYADLKRAAENSFRDLLQKEAGTPGPPAWTTPERKSNQPRQKFLKSRKHEN
jgi:hypothetical protein